MEITSIAVVGSMVILASCLIATNPSYKAKKQKESYLKLLEKQIDQKTIELFNLRERVEINRVDHNYNLTRLEMEVLNIYDNSNIRIPVEILEDLHNQKLEDYGDIFKYIESQRKYWKLENTKVPFKGKEK